MACYLLFTLKNHNRISGRLIIARDWECHIQHVSRDSNACADQLVHDALQLIILVRFLLF